mgnify:CR=1 FL=1
MKKRILSKMILTLMIAGTIATSTACSADTNNLVTNVATDAKLDLKQCVYVWAENSTNNYYISILGHYDNGNKYSVGGYVSSLNGYYDHKDFRIAYKVSKEEYSKVVSFSTKTIPNLTQEEISFIENIVATYDPVEVKDLEVSEEDIHNKFNESFRYNENELTAE